VLRTGTRFGVVTLLLMLTGIARAQMWPAGCGKDDVQFKVKTDKKQPVRSSPEAGKAQIIFVEAVKGPFGTAPIARFGVDGAWVGADRGTSYFVVSVDPGEHQLCEPPIGCTIGEARCWQGDGARRSRTGLLLRVQDRQDRDWHPQNSRWRRCRHGR
jgi:hypothetical protein